MPVADALRAHATFVDETPNLCHNLESISGEGSMKAVNGYKARPEAAAQATDRALVAQSKCRAQALRCMRHRTSDFRRQYSYFCTYFGTSVSTASKPTNTSEFVLFLLEMQVKSSTCSGT